MLFVRKRCVESFNYAILTEDQDEVRIYVCLLTAYGGRHREELYG